MNRVSQNQCSVSESIFVDEIGIEIGIYGDYRLKSAYQPIFARAGDVLTPVAVEASVAPFLSGKPIPPSAFFRKILRPDASFIDEMSLTLHLRNLCNVGVENLELFVRHNPGSHADFDKSLLEIALMVQTLGDLGLSPTLLVCEIEKADELDPESLLRLAGALRGHGIRVAVDGFSVGQATERLMQRLQPDIVKIGGSSFGKVASEPAAVRLFGQLISGLRANGAKVLVNGIETDGQLLVALEQGADLVQGSYLGKPALAGTIFDETPRQMPSAERPGGVVISLFG